MDLQGVGAIVTGGASGLGEGTVRRLAAAGANVVIADLNEERGKEIAAELGGGTEFVRADVTSEEEIQEVVRVASSRGPLRVAVNCGGKAGSGGRTVGRDGSPASLEGFEFTVKTFLSGTFNVSRLAAAQMAKEEALRRRRARGHRHDVVDRGHRGPDRSGGVLGREGRHHRPDASDGT